MNMSCHDFILDDGAAHCLCTAQNHLWSFCLCARHRLRDTLSKAPSLPLTFFTSLCPSATLLRPSFSFLSSQYEPLGGYWTRGGRARHCQRTPFFDFVLSCKRIYMICIYVYTGGKMKSRRVHTQNMRHTPPSVFGRHLSLCRPGESGFVPLALLLLACWMSSCKAVTARAGLCRSVLRPGSRARFLAVPLSHGTCDMTTAGFTRGKRPIAGSGAKLAAERRPGTGGTKHKDVFVKACQWFTRCLSLVPFLRSRSGRSFTGLWPQENFWYTCRGITWERGGGP